MNVYPIFFDAQQQAALWELLGRIKSAAEKQSQGTCTVYRDFYDSIRAINPNITSVSTNYYDCNGTIAFAIRLTNKYKSLINFGGELCMGFVFGAPPGYLMNYMHLRW